MTAAPGDLLAACERILGPVTVVRDLSWPHSGNQVVELADGDGRLWIGKTVGNDGGYQRELRALRDWVPALRGRGPALRAVDDGHRLLIMARLPGRLVEETAAEFDPAVHAQAGRLTRLLHDSEPPRLDDGIAAATVRKLEDWIGRGRHLLTDEDIEFARAEVSPMTTFGPVLTVPTHMDNQPRNWVIDDNGLVGLIDFGLSKRDVWIRDLRRLYFQQWAGRPELRSAFHAGYGRQPTQVDRRMLRCYLAYAALSTVVWAHEYGDSGFEEHGRHMLAQLRAGHAPVD